MTKRHSAFTAVLAAAAIALTGFATTSASAATAGFVGVILPDAASSNRWESADRPFLTAAFKAAGVTVDIQNANGDVAAFQTIAEAASGRITPTKPVVAAEAEVVAKPVSAIAAAASTAVNALRRLVIFTYLSRGCSQPWLKPIFSHQLEISG